MSAVYYIILGRSGLLFNKKQEINFEERHATISFKVSKEMSPACRVFVYYIQSSGEIIYDQISFDVGSLSSHVVGLFHKLGSGELHTTWVFLAGFGIHGGCG